jgi:beta-lactamase regulating signal transducer with metallopeptidase domain
MPDSLALHLSAYALTYAVHSTVLLGLAALALRRARLDPLLVARAWKVALLGGLGTALVHTSTGFAPLLPRLDLAAGAASLRSLDPRLAPARAALPATPAPDVAAPSGPATEALARTPTALPAALGAAEPLASDFGRNTLLAMWLCGSLYGLLRLRSRRGRFQSRVGDRLPVWDEELREALARLCRRAGLRRPVRLSRSPSIQVPLTWGLWRPEICLPERAIAELEPAELQAVLAHELGHVVRRDALWLGIGQALDALCFFQPLNRLGRRALAREAEHLADAFAVQLTGRPLTLARCLAKVATWIEVEASGRPAQASAMASSRHALLERVERLLEPRPLAGRRAAATAAVLAVPVLLLPLMPAVAAHTERGAPRSAAAPSAAADLSAEFPRERLATLEEWVLPRTTELPRHSRHDLPALVEELGVQLAAVAAELAALEAHPRAAEHGAALARCAARLRSLEATLARASALLQTRSPGVASAGSD